MIFTYVVCKSPIAPIRTAPSHRVEMSSQLLFGERATVLSTDGDWVYIECLWDHYEGWIHQGHLSFINYKQFSKTSKAMVGYAAGKLILQDIPAQLTPGAELFGMKSSKFPWLHNDAVVYKGSKLKLEDCNNTAIEQASILPFLGTSYVWGGRSLQGIDCSGLSQMVYKLHQIKLPRDAKDQARLGEEVSFLQEAQCGDLAFFDDEDGNITHVGILLNEATIIHASQQSGSVVIDAIDQGGIISKSLKKRTAKLRIIKRYI